MIQRRAADDSVDSDEYKESGHLQVPPNICQNHRCPVVLYCETCEALCCEQCTITGPHNNKEHWLMQIEQAYENRISKLRYLVLNVVSSKRSEIVSQLGKVRLLLEGVHRIKEEIEYSTREYFVHMQDRLDRSYSEKMSRLQLQFESTNADIKTIEALVAELEQTSQKKNDAAVFMRSLPVHRDNISFLVTKPFQKEITEAPYDLPRELYDLRRELEALFEYESLLDFKNEIIAQLGREALNKKKKVEEQMVETEAEQEIAAWTKLADKLSSQLGELSMVCHFCAEPLNENTANARCLVNREDNMALKITFRGFTDVTPDFDDYGSSFHYFAKPKQEVLKDPHLMNIMNNHIYRIPGERNPYKEALLHEVQLLLNHIRRCLEETGVDLLPLLEQHDRFQVRVVNKVTLVFILHEHLGVQEEAISPLIHLLDPFRRDLINIDEFMLILKTPGAISNLPFFFYADQSVCDGYAEYLHKFEAFRKSLEAKERQERERFQKAQIQREKDLMQREAKLAATAGQKQGGSSNPRRQSESSQPQPARPVRKVSVQPSRNMIAGFRQV